MPLPHEHGTWNGIHYFYQSYFERYRRERCPILDARGQVVDPATLEAEEEEEEEEEEEVRSPGTGDEEGPKAG